MIIKAFFLMMFFATSAFSQWTSSRPDGHAPLGVMGDHTHHAGEVMFSYRFMHMNMEGSLKGTVSIDDAQVVSPNGENFIITPTKMPMQMHMFGLMYAPSDKITLMAMLPITSLEMDHLTRSSAEFTTKSSGVGDVKITALYTLSKFGNQHVHLHGGVSLPAGSIDETDVTPASAPNETQLPYPMQIGSGTFDLLPGITYLGQSGDWSWGGQGSAKIRLGENDNGYRLGNQFSITAWSARNLTKLISASVRLAGQATGNIEGNDSRFDGAVTARMVPTVFTNLRGGKRVDAGLGLNLYLQEGRLRGLRFAIEALVPIYQDLDGPQLETDLQLIAGTQYAF